MRSIESSIQTAERARRRSGSALVTRRRNWVPVDEKRYGVGARNADLVGFSHGPFEDLADALALLGEDDNHRYVWRLCPNSNDDARILEWAPGLDGWEVVEGLLHEENRVCRDYAAEHFPVTPEPAKPERKTRTVLDVPPTHLLNLQEVLRLHGLLDEGTAKIIDQLQTYANNHEKPALREFGSRVLELLNTCSRRMARTIEVPLETGHDREP